MTNLRLFTLLIALLLAPLAVLSQDAAQSVQADRSTTAVQPQHPKNTGAQIGRDASGRPVLPVDGQPEALNPAVLLCDGPAFAQIFAKAELEQLVVWVKELSSIRDEAPHVTT